MRVFSSESWSKGIAITQSNSVGFNVQLTTYTQVCWSTKHIFFVIYFLVGQFNRSKVVKISFFWCFFFLFLFFFRLLWFFSSGNIFSNLCFFLCFLFSCSFFFCFFYSLKFCLCFWSLIMSLKLSLRYWLSWLWKSSCNLEHLTSTFTV